MGRKQGLVRNLLPAMICPLNGLPEGFAVKLCFQQKSIQHQSNIDHSNHFILFLSDIKAGQYRRFIAHMFQDFSCLPRPKVLQYSQA